MKKYEQESKSHYELYILTHGQESLVDVATPITTGDDLNALSMKARDLFVARYKDIDSYDKVRTRYDAFDDYILYEYSIGVIFRASMLVEQQVAEAFDLAVRYHYKQKRKGDGKQYIIHIMMISQMLYDLFLQRKVDRATLLAGICHDLLEDTTCSEEEIIKVCGQEVLDIVKAVSNDPELDDTKYWEQKKEDYIKSVEAGGEKAMMVALCDKMVNMQSLFAQYDIEGSGVWSHFNRGKEKKVWFEKNVLTMLQKHLTSSQVGEYEKMIVKLESLESEENTSKT